jgi:hypothetical protein
MKVRWYDLIAECVEDGASTGWTRAHKHVDNPEREAVESAIVDAIMLELVERIDFETTIFPLDPVS